MEKKSAPSLKDPAIFFLTFCGAGFSPVAPGTVGTLAFAPFLYAIGQFNAPFFFFIPFLIILTSASCFIAEFAQKKYEVHDPGWIVIDEVVGLMTAWLFAQNNSLLHLGIIVFLFRFFDIIKIWPASFFDKKVTHGAGTILDDVVSGIFAGLVYLGTWHLFQF